MARREERAYREYLSDEQRSQAGCIGVQSGTVIRGRVPSARPDMRYSVGMADRVGHEDQTGGAVKERVREKTKEPALYGVVLLNDDYTPMQFVIDVLETVCQKSPAEAYRIMMQVHLNGRGVAGIYPWEVAETKVDTILSRARAAGHPLQATIEDA